MTAHKHFKALVRERMTKTGESYSSARRQLLRDRPHIENGPTRWHLAGSVPAATALRVLLTAAGIRDDSDGRPLTEAMAFGIGGGIGLGIAQFFYEKEDVATFFVAGRNSWHDDQAFITSGLQRLGVAFECSETGSAKAAEANLRAALGGGRPCVAFVDSASLPHRAMPTQYQGGGYHVVTVYDMDGARGVARIGDVSDEPIEIRLEALAAARARIKKFKNRIIAIRPDGPAKVEFARGVRAALGACHAGLMTPAIKGQANMFTLAGLGKLAERMADSKDKEGWERVFADGHRFWAALTGFHEYIEHYGTGGGLCRPIFAEFLMEAGQRLKQRGFAPLAERYHDLGARWSRLAQSALPGDLPAFQRVRELFARRAEATASGDRDALGTAWREIAEQQLGSKTDFSLSERAATELRRGLQAQVRELHREELAAHAALGELLSASW